MTEAQTRQKLIKVLRGAYSGEMAAAFAYRGHWKSVKTPKERQKIKDIETEEWHHRNLVREMLRSLGGKPSISKEALLWTIGRTLGALCFVAGWFWPMFFAGRLETANVDEYATATKLATDLKLMQIAVQLNQMSEVELDHERFFYETIQNHWLLPLAKKLFHATPIYPLRLQDSKLQGSPRG